MQKSTLYIMNIYLHISMLMIYDMFTLIYCHFYLIFLCAGILHTNFYIITHLFSDYKTLK